MNTIIKRGAAALAVSSAALALIFSPSCSGRGTVDPGSIVEVDSPSPSARIENLSPTPGLTPAPTPAVYSFVTADNSAIGDGQFVLVNYNHSYAHTDAVELQVRPVGKSRQLLLAKTDAALLPDVNSALQEFAEGFYDETGGDRLLVTSAFRTEQYQRELYDDYVKQHGEEMARIYVADPGASEHHTGLAVDLSTMSKDGLRIPLIEHEKFAWVTSHCADYGFILRYPVGSVETTRVAYEPWHFRYLGRVNAHACTALGMVYEEYIEHLKVYTVESGMLHVQLTQSGAELAVADIGALPPSGWLIYFVPASENGETPIPIPNACAEYFISGNNEDGFIVEVLIATENGSN
ncbi:MAG: M15 family metallopeptidase [Clostridia bacterium]|nr:M15 family metallopeptidase [Clostridia bacterium]